MVKRIPWLTSVIFLFFFATIANSIVVEKKPKLFYRNPALYIPTMHTRAAGANFAEAEAGLRTMGVLAGNAFYDRRAGNWGTIVMSVPLIPARGNRLWWQQEVKSQALESFLHFVKQNQSTFAVDPSEFSTPLTSVHENSDIIQIHIDRHHAGIKVLNSFANATINHGNLVLLGFHNWAPIHISPRAAFSSDQAIHRVHQFANGSVISRFRKQPYLAIVPLAKGLDGFDFRLIWILTPVVEDDRANYEAYVDAKTGELLLFADQNDYAARQVIGGVYPVSNDGASPSGIPDGVEQPDYSMPFADITFSDNTVDFTTSGGVLGCFPGTIQTSLQGKYVALNDVCGPISESSASGDLDLGASGGTDCVVPSGHSAGDTHASRTAFSELNRIKEMARGWLPQNPWLNDQLTANVNIEDTCNGFWDGGTVNFYQSGGGCNNTGEIAAVFDHEWGHGMDDNDTNGLISSPGEAIADIYAFLRLRTSCIGRGFQNTACDGYSDTCLTCTGVRDIDYDKHSSHQPHDIDWIFTPYPLGGCVAVPGAQQFGPCNQETHCEGMVPAESVHDLVERTLQSPPFNYSSNTAGEIGTRLTYLGSANINQWYQCSAQTLSGDGCNADGGYLNYLAVDDDDGNLNNGTPHMQAIYDAFNAHQIACNLPVVQNQGCSGAPASAPSVTAIPRDQGVALSWTSVPNASKYWVFRTEGVHGCNFGKVRIGETTGTSFVDENIRNDSSYFYGVMAIGTNDSCMGPMSTCLEAVPQAGPNFKMKANSESLSVAGGDADPFIDNCETGEVKFIVNNSGIGDLTNVRIVSVTPLSHPATVITTSLPAIFAAKLPECSNAEGNFTFMASNLSYNDTLRFQVSVTADEIFPLTRGLIAEFVGAESDFSALQATKTFSFESSMEDWSVPSGTFNRTSAGGGGNLTSFYLASSSLVDGQCDVARSPILQLSASSTLSLYNQFSTEPMSTSWFDRANIGVIDLSNKKRMTISPDGGARPYLASGSGGACATSGQPGWAGPGPGWLQSTWSNSALLAATFAGKNIQLDMAYGTDSSVSLAGFWFDEVALTNVKYQIPDTQTNSCGVRIAIENLGVVEGNSGQTAAQIKVSLNQSTGVPVSVTYTTNNGTAQSGSDYVADTNVLTIPAGQTSGIIPIAVLGDSTQETNETFSVDLSLPVNATIADSHGIVTILDEDYAQITIDNISLVEGNSGTSQAVFTVSLTALRSVPVTIEYATSDGTALAGRDYAASSGVATIPAGNPSTTIQIPVYGDTLLEPDETFFVNLSNPGNAALTDAQGAASILNDETGSPQIILDSVTIDDAVGNSSGGIDSNECVSLMVRLKNVGASTATNIAATVSTSTPNASMTLGNSSYPDIAPAATALNNIQFRLNTSASFNCGTVVQFNMTITTGQGVFTFPFQLVSGSPSNASFAYALPVPVPDGLPTGIDSGINVSGISNPISKVTVSLYISHTWVEDLDVSLVGPDGTTVVLTSDNGADGDDYGQNCPADGNDTTFDDAASTSIVGSSPPFVGTFRPEEFLSAFAGKSGAAVNGTWNLHVVDDTFIDNGTIECWTLTITSSSCQAGTGSCAPFSPPGETTQLIWSSGSKISASWNSEANASWYNIYEGLSEDLPKLMDANPDSCRRWSGTATTTGNSLMQTPPPGKFYWYIVRAANGAGEGTAGNATSGPRVHNSQGPCP